MKQFDVIIIGSGPSGLMCASKIDNKRVLLLERNETIGGKIKVSGGGRCNVTNNKDIDSFLKNVPKNNKFLFSTLNNFGPWQIIDFFKQHDCPLVEEKDNKMFPKSHDSRSIIDVFKRIINNKDVTIKTKYLVENVEYTNGEYIINDTFTSNTLVVATGGNTYRHLGTDGFGYKVAQNMGIIVTDTSPVEAPLVSNSQIIASKQVQGISLQDVKANVYANNKRVFSKQHDLLFTHFGLSGPLALQSSFYINKALKTGKGPVTFEIIIDEQYKDSSIVPKRLLPYIIDNKIIIEISDIRGAKHGFVTDGGISLKEINPKSFATKKYPSLYFIGEVLDINAFTGGYNITTCLSEGYSCALAINEQ